MQVNDHRMAVIANNIANAQTAGFKHDLALVRLRLVESRSNPNGFPYVHPVLDGMTGGITPTTTHHSFEQGSIEITGNPLDMAIDGEGFFTVSDQEETRYTRDGTFTRNIAGELVLSSSGGRWRVLDDGGAPIPIRPEGGDVKVSSDGTIRQGDAIVATISLVTNADLQSLRKVGQNLFENTAGEMIPASGRISGGARENANFDPILGLASMIEATRAYQLNATLIQLQDYLTGQAVSRIGRVA